MSLSLRRDESRSRNGDEHAPSGYETAHDEEILKVRHPLCGAEGLQLGMADAEMEEDA